MKSLTSIEVNEYIEKFSEIEPSLERIVSNLNCDSVTIKVTGTVKPHLVTKIQKYLIDHDIQVTTEYSGVAVLNRLYGGK